MTTSERMYNHLLSQFRNKPNIKAFLNAVGNELDSIDKVREQIRTQIWPDTAVGKQLDMCGEVADITRRVENERTAKERKNLVNRKFQTLILCSASGSENNA